jgi:hypothetical protein
VKQKHSNAVAAKKSAIKLQTAGSSSRTRIGLQSKGTTWRNSNASTVSIKDTSTVQTLISKLSEQTPTKTPSTQTNYYHLNSSPHCV